MSERRSDELETVRPLVGKPRCRHVLVHLLENDYGNLEDIALRIAASENDESVRAVDIDDHEDVVVSLVHNHLPRLADHGVVEWDHRSGDVVPAENFEVVEPVLEQARAAGDDDAIVEESLLSFLYRESPRKVAVGEEL